MLVGRDISKLKKVEEKLRASELQLRRLSDNAPGVLFSLDRRSDGTTFMSYISHRIEDLTGLQPGEMVPNLAKFSSTIHPDDRQKVLSAFDDSAYNLGPVSVEFRLVHAEKGDVWIESRATPECQSDGSIMWYGFLYDITRNKKLEKELFLARKLEIIGQLAGGVAHEVRNPLNAILSLTEALFTEEGIAGNQTYLPYIERIRNQVTRLSKLMSDLLSLGRPIRKAGFQVLELESICNVAVKTWTSDSTMKTNPISIVRDPVLVASLVRIDPFHFTQILVNLFDNAAQSSPIETEIVLKISHPGNSMVRLEVIDQGTGIPSGKLDRIFEPFFTLAKGGTGLGLTLVKHLVEGMGGEILIQNNEPPPGCSAIIMIPFADRDERVH
jgi:two-component system NtrC family sensor kinase